MGTQSFTFNGLQGSDREIENIAALIPGTPKLLDTPFSQNALESHLSDDNIVHLAPHAAVIWRKPEESFILFGNGDRVNLRNVENWKLTRVNLVVVSACQKGLGKILGNAEEILGLGYPMQKAGALATLASRWVVDDLGTQALMDAFYAALQTKDMGTDPRSTTAAALRSPLLTLTHPYYWAALMIIGNR